MTMVYLFHMSDADFIITTIQTKINDLHDLGVKRIGIFGSSVRGDAKPTSDIDVVIDFEDGKKSYRNFIGTATYLEKLFNRKIDAITPNSISPYLKADIDKEIRYVQI